MIEKRSSGGYYSAGMRPSIRLVPHLLLALCALPAIAAPASKPQGAAVAVFGLPLGGKLALAECKSAMESGPCWISKPFVAKRGDRRGWIRPMNPDALPAWSAHAAFEVELGSDGRLEVITVKSDKAADQDISAIVESISSRFGQARDGLLYRVDVASANWANDEISIRMLCNPRVRCVVDFTTPKRAEEQGKRAASHRAREAARPIAP